MEIQVSDSHRPILESLIATGRFETASEVVEAGIRLLESEEQLRQKIKIGLDQANRGELLEHDQVFSDLRRRLHSHGKD